MGPQEGHRIKRIISFQLKDTSTTWVHNMDTESNVASVFNQKAQQTHVSKVQTKRQ